MFKVAICGKANSGKNTVSKILVEKIRLWIPSVKEEVVAFADPIKEMARQMFPSLPKKFFYGPSKFRAEIIPGAFKDGNPLTVRQLLIDLGTGVGREYKNNVWIEALDHRVDKARKNGRGVVIVTDVRFRNEFDHLKTQDYFQIRLLRDAHLKIDHASETNQDSIKDDEFDYVLTNNGTLTDLEQEINKIVLLLKSQ